MKKNYSQTLKRYAALTGSVALAGTKLAQAQVVYTDTIPDVTLSNDTLFIDFDKDGTDDMSLIQGSNYFYTFARVERPSGAISDIEVVGNSGDHPFVLSKGTTVGYGSDWTSPGYGASNLGRTTYSGIEGEFAGAGDQYLGFRFEISGQYHYGWVLVNVNSGASQMVVKSWAYESIQDLDIIINSATPTVEIQGAPASRNLTPFTVTFEFSEDVTGFDVSDITVGNGTAGNFQTTDDNTYTADITPDGNGDITIDVNAGVAQNKITPIDNAAATQVVVTLDQTAPTVDILNEPSSVTDMNPFIVKFQFNEDVSGFDVSDITVGNGSASNFLMINPSTYIADITPDGNGNITIDVASSTVQDIALNNNTAATQAVVTYNPPTGVDGGIAASVNVYPNPVVNVVTIDGVDVVSVTVLDGNGSQVASSSSNAVDLSGLASGTYILNIETNDGGILKRVIKE